MDTAEKIVPLTAPSPIAKRVLARRQILEAERDAVKTGAAELALKSALGDLDARAALAAMPGKIAALQLEADLAHEAHQLAIKQDSEAELAWRAARHQLPVDEVLKGFNADECPHLCQPGIVGGCCLAGGAPHAGPDCMHPTRHGTFHQFALDNSGRRIFPHGHHPRASQVFDAACDKIGPQVKGKFSHD
jgi:hypothetical protein